MSGLGLSDVQAFALAVAGGLVAYILLVIAVMRRDRARVRDANWLMYRWGGGLIVDLVTRWRGPRRLTDRRERG